MKRYFINFFMIFCIFSMIILPCFATGASDSIAIVKQPSDYLSGNDTGYFSVVVDGPVQSYQWQFSYDMKTWTSATHSSGKTPNYRIISSNHKELYVRCVITGDDGTVLITRSALLTFEPANFFSFISSALRYVINYISQIVFSLTSPEGSLYPLLPILAIGIAVTVVLVVIRIGKELAWGL